MNTHPNASASRLRRFIFKLLTPRRVSIAIDDLPLFGERGEAVRAHVLEAWWLSPVWVELQEDRILAFGLWLPMDTGEPTSESHPDACGGDNKACHSEEPSENPVLSDVVGSKATDVGVASPLSNSTIRPGVYIGGRTLAGDLARPAAVAILAAAVYALVVLA